VTPISSSQKKSAYVEKQGRLRTKRRQKFEHGSESVLVHRDALRTAHRGELELGRVQDRIHFVVRQ